jgi:hypothetical protein
MFSFGVSRTTAREWNRGKCTRKSRRPNPEGNECRQSCAIKCARERGFPSTLEPPSRAVSPRAACEPFPRAKRKWRAFQLPSESKIMGSSLVLSNLRREREEREPKMVVHYKVHNPWDWDTKGGTGTHSARDWYEPVSFSTSTGTHFMWPSSTPRPATRHALTPQALSQVGEALGNGPPIIYPREPAVPVEEPYIGARHAGRQKERQRTHSARANLESTLRWRPIDDRAYHDPAGAPFRRPT